MNPFNVSPCSISTTTNQSFENHRKIASMTIFMKRIFSARNSKDVKVKNMNLILSESSDIKSIDDTMHSSVSVKIENEEKKTKRKKSVRFYELVTVITVPNRDELDLMSRDMWYSNMEIQTFRKETMTEITSYAVSHRISKKEAIYRLFKALTGVSST